MRPLSRLVLDDGTASEGNLQLLSVEELRSAAGVTGDSADEDLAALGEAVGEIIANFCKVRAAEDSVPTLMAQDLVETFYLDGPVDSLVLARRPAVLASVNLNDSEVDTGNVRLLGGAGILRYGDSSWSAWSAGTIVVSYVGGFSVVPQAVRIAAKAMVKTLYAASQAATTTAGAVRSLTLEGVGQVSYDTSNSAVSGEDPLPTHIAALLAPYCNVVA